MEQHLPNPVRGRINAVFFHAIDGYMHRKYGALKRRLLADLPAPILELGAGTGANLRYYRRRSAVIAAEPNVHMHGLLGRRARRWDIRLDVRPWRAEALDLPEGCVEAVVSSLVLCTVSDPDAAVREVLRVLRPGGRFVCIEHVAAARSTLIGRLQRWVFHPWRWLFEGCHTHRDTAAVLERAGFSRVEIRPFTLRSVFLPVRPQIAAVCTK